MRSRSQQISGEANKTVSALRWSPRAFEPAEAFYRKHVCCLYATGLHKTLRLQQEHKQPDAKTRTFNCHLSAFTFKILASTFCGTSTGACLLRGYAHFPQTRQRCVKGNVINCSFISAAYNETGALRIHFCVLLLQKHANYYFSNWQCKRTACINKTRDDQSSLLSSRESHCICGRIRQTNFRRLDHPAIFLRQMAF